MIKKFSSTTEFFILSHKMGIGIRIRITEGLDPDASPDLMNMDAQHCFQKICLELSIKNAVMVFL